MFPKHGGGPGHQNASQVREFTSRLHFNGLLPGVLSCDPRGMAGFGKLVALAGVKSVPIGTVFRSKGQKCTNLVRFSGFLVLLSRFVVGGQEIIPARGWIEEEAGLDSRRQR